MLYFVSDVDLCRYNGSLLKGACLMNGKKRLIQAKYRAKKKEMQENNKSIAVFYLLALIVLILMQTDFGSKSIFPFDGNGNYTYYSE